MTADVFDREGEWEVRTTVYLDGEEVGTCDALGGVYDFAVNSVVTNLERRELNRPCGAA